MIHLLCAGFDNEVATSRGVYREVASSGELVVQVLQ